jgi:hypothetical protein
MADNLRLYHIELHGGIRSMGYFRIALILGAIVLFLASPVWATTYYVKTTGDDTKSGTSEANAWQHVCRACTTMVAGDTVLIRAGTYNENCPSNGYCGGGGEPSCGPLTPKNSGTSGNEIVYKGYPGERPIIKGDNGGDYDDYSANLHGVSYIILDSLQITESWRGITIQDCDHITVKNCLA